MDDQDGKQNKKEDSCWDAIDDAHTDSHRPPEWIEVEGGWQRGRLPGAE